MRFSHALYFAFLALLLFCAQVQAQEFEIEENQLDSAMEPPIIVSEFDTRDYRLVTLENKLKVLLISDKDADKVRGDESTFLRSFG